MKKGNVLIVSKTNMGNERVCVGGIDIDNNCSVRLLNEYGYNENSSDCPYNILDIWYVEYIFSSNRAYPHSHEDTKVFNRSKVGVFNVKDNNLRDFITAHGIQIYAGSLDGLFNRCLKSTNNGSRYVSKDNIPDYSTCFWINDKSLIRRNYPDKIKFYYPDGIHRYGCNITYVGFEREVIDIIPPESLIRMSLAHWWRPKDVPDTEEEKCYLQLSGYFI